MIQRFAANAQVQPINNEIILKTEREPVIKNESDLDEMPFEQERVMLLDERVQIDQLKSEKSKIIGELATIKSEKQKMELRIQRMAGQLELRDQKIQSLSCDLAKAREKIGAMEVKIKMQEEQEKKKVSNLSRQKSVLSAQIQQLNLSTSHNFAGVEPEKAETETVTASVSDECEYEVESIRKHKIVKGDRHFLVRWKNFPPKFDSWVKEKNMNCPKILKQYKKSKKLR